MRTNSEYAKQFIKQLENLTERALQLVGRQREEILLLKNEIKDMRDREAQTTAINVENQRIIAQLKKENATQKKRIETLKARLEVSEAKPRSPALSAATAPSAVSVNPHSFLSRKKTTASQKRKPTTTPTVNQKPMHF